MFKYANDSRDSLNQQISSLEGSEITVILAGEATKLYFTDVHVQDLKAVLDVESHEESA